MTDVQQPDENENENVGQDTGHDVAEHRLSTGPNEPGSHGEPQGDPANATQENVPAGMQPTTLGQQTQSEAARDYERREQDETAGEAADGGAVSGSIADQEVEPAVQLGEDGRLHQVKQIKTR